MLSCGLVSHHQCCKLLALSSFPKHNLHAYLFSVGLGATCLKHSWCAAPATNCRKNDLASWFAGIGRCSILRTDVNDAEQMRQEGVSPSLPFTFLPILLSAHTHTYIVTVHFDYIMYGTIIRYYCTIKSR